VILESTAYPGTTDESVLSVLEESGLKVGEDFFLCFSPERVNRSTFQTKDIRTGADSDSAKLQLLTRFLCHLPYGPIDFCLLSNKVDKERER
jgi:hypothetical protein